MNFKSILSGLVAGLALTVCASAGLAQSSATPDASAIEHQVRRAMQATGARGLALAVIDDGQVTRVASYGERNAAGEPLETDTVMYGASLTKAVFSYLVMQLVDEGRLDLDRPIGDLLPQPLPDYNTPEVMDRYERWGDLADDDRWRTLTPRMLLTHSSGFANYSFLEPDGKLSIHFQPGTRYAYSGAGILLLQFVLEEGLGLDVGQEIQQRVLTPLGMTRSSLTCRPDFAGNLADGWTLSGEAQPHDERSRTRASGSMDTTIEDFSRFAAAFVSGRGLSERSRRAMAGKALAITTASQFPTLQEELPQADRRADLATGLGLIVFQGPQGAAFIRGGHNDTTGNIWVCVETGRRCVVLLSNDVRAEAAFPALVGFILGETGAPWPWIMGDLPFWRVE